MSHRLLWLLCVLCMIAAGFTGPAAAEKNYPNKPIRLIVPYPPGGGNDTLARMFAAKLVEAWQQQVIVDNRPGAGTTLGVSIAARAVPDGHTLLLSSIATHAIAPNLYAKPGYDPVKDFAPITLLAVAPTVLVRHPSLPAATLKDLIALIKSKPGEIRYASGGSGTPPHMAGVIFASMTGTRLLHVPYKGGGPAITGLMGGEVQIMFDTAASILPHVRSGKLQPLAIARAQRLPDYPQIPTFSEAGLAGYEVNAWYSMHAPAGVPASIINKLNVELVRHLQLADIRQRLQQLGSEPVGNSPAELAKFVQAENRKYAEAIKESGAKAE
ncbi:MAG: tripartite tricarboxylate transporter substrate binding protein [Burkholderiales bacterium]|nr:tripartite tricarboxylate transporter substrate binding protein [Burkholderiales bacterium]